MQTKYIEHFIEVPTEYVEANGLRYAYRKFGNPTGMPIVCLQHFTGTLDNWDPVIVDGLATNREVIAIDNTGVGNSEGETPDNVQAMSRDAISVITALGITKCDLLGFSLGGFIAQTIAVMRPDLFRKIILVGTAPQGALALRSFPQLVEQAFAREPMEIFLFIFATQSEKSRGKISETLGRLYARKQDRDKEPTMKTIRAQVTALTRWGTDKPTIDLKKIEQPVLIIQGSNDSMMNSDSSLDLFRQIPNSIMTFYPDSAHGSFFQYPELFVSQANFFLDHFE